MDLNWWLPPVAAFVISFFTSMVGVSGAFLLLPIQMSVMGLTGPSVSGTNLVFNLIAIPSGVYRFWRERRILWPLAVAVVVGTIPGVIVGGFIRLTWLANARRFKFFVGCVLLYIGTRLLYDLVKSRNQTKAPPSKTDTGTRTIRFTSRILIFEYRGHEYRCKPVTIMLVCLIVGLIGGIYGIGGGSIVAPFFVGILGLPIHTIAGATLMGTFVTSVVGVGFYQLVAPFYPTITVAPDWWLGIRFGIGGIAGMYLGARVQRYVPALWLKVFLTAILFFTSLSYIVGFFRK